MAQQVNKCLKCLFATYNSIFLILTITGLSASLMGRGLGPPTWETILGAGIVICTTSLGIFGAHKANTCALVVYSGVVGIGMLICSYYVMELMKNKSEIVRVLGGDSEAVAMYKLMVGFLCAEVVIMFLGLAMAVPLLCQMCVSRQENTNAAV